MFVVMPFFRNAGTLALGPNLAGDGQRDATGRRLRGEM